VRVIIPKIKKVRKKIKNKKKNRKLMVLGSKK